MPAGSLVAGVNGKPIRNTLQSLCDVIADLPTGTEVELAIAQPGNTRTRSVRLKLR